jgi:hypothetical protein
MSFTEGRWLGIVGLMLIVLSCAPLPETIIPEGDTVGTLDLPSTGTVPLEWGSLVSVTVNPWGDLTLLWFQDDTGTIRSVAFDHSTQQFRPQAVLIRRR